MEFLKFSLSGFDDFLVYFGLSIGFVVLYLAIYVRATPYPEFALIRAGNAAAAARRAPGARRRARREADRAALVCAAPDPRPAPSPAPALHPGKPRSRSGF